MKRNCTAIPVDFDAEEIIGGKLVKIMLFVKPIDETGSVRPNGQTVSGKFIFIRNGINQLEELIQDREGVTCKEVVNLALEKAKTRLRDRYTGSNVDIESILAFIERTTNAWVEEAYK